MKRRKLVVVAFFCLLSCCSIISLVLLAQRNKSITLLENDVNEKENENERLKARISDLENENQSLESQIAVQAKRVQQQIIERQNSFQSGATLGNGTTVVFKKSGCDYFILENTSGYILAEWMGGHDPEVGEVLFGDFNSFGTKDFPNSNNTECHLWIDDYMLSKESALEKINEKCN